MKDPDLPPLDPELDELLAAERAGPGPSADALERMAARFDAALPPDGSDSGGGGDGGAVHGAGSVGAAAATTAKGLTFGIPTLLGALALGAGGGALLHSELAPVPTVVTTVLVPVVTEAPEAVEPRPEPRVAGSVALATPVDEARTPSSEATPAPTLAEPPSSASTPVAPTALTPPDAAKRASDLREENALISRAQSALARGSAGEALTALREHRDRFSRGQLIEEREALWVQALARSGQSEAAKQRAEGFLKRFPRSVFAPSVRAAAGLDP